MHIGGVPVKLTCRDFETVSPLGRQVGATAVNAVGLGCWLTSAMTPTSCGDDDERAEGPAQPPGAPLVLLGLLDLDLSHRALSGALFTRHGQPS